MRLAHRIFAALYDPLTAGAERAGVAKARRELLAGARGRVLEIGAGTGRNVEHYPAGSDVTYTEPDPYMAKRLRARTAKVVEAGAEQLPFEDRSFDTVVSTLVLCTVTDVPASLREIRRVLVPGGRLLFLEHVRADPGSTLERWQDRLHGPWHALAGGCNCNRDLLSSLDAQSFAVEELRRESWRFMPPLVRPVVIGAAAPVS
jgi:ubiquinone/menaquinone biosynthesis C-methylase UbiE